MEITETLLEMHFHRAILDYFANSYGVKFLRLIKPSPQKEKWVGFDQGWSNTELDTNQLYSELKEAIQQKNTKIQKFYLGIFLQFKVVEYMLKRSKHIPRGYYIPYFRTELYLEPDPETGLSQHETLKILGKIENAYPYYACPMLFDEDEIYRGPNLNKLRLVPLSSSPDGWLTNDRHFITFQTQEDPSPLWHSKPTDGKSFSFHEWLAESNRERPKLLKPQEATTLLKEIESTLHQHILLDYYEQKKLEYSKAKIVSEEKEDKVKVEELPERDNPIPSSFSLVEFEASTSVK